MVTSTSFKTANVAQRPRNRHARQLVQKLMGVSFQESGS